MLYYTLSLLLSCACKQGYVKNVTPKGCFIMISRKFDAKILLSNLSDGYIENPEREFPIGKLVTGKYVFLVSFLCDYW